MPGPAPRNDAYWDTMKDAPAPLKIRACLGVEVLTESCLPFLMSLDNSLVAAG